MTPPDDPEPAGQGDHRAPTLAFWLIGVAAAFAYAPSFSGPFIFDDLASIPDNPTIRSLWPLGPVLSPPHENSATVGGRPFLNFTFALNHALGGTEVWGYHFANLVIHVTAGLALFGVLRRALGLVPALARRADTVALFTALLWALHPLQTESVSYVVQRAESLCGLLVLITLYAFLRASASTRPLGWSIISVAACLLGVATKEVAATAPLLVLLFDLTLVAGSFRAALRARGIYYAALTATWIVLAALVASTAGRGGTAGLGVDVTPWGYLGSQPLALTRYLGLALWPFPLVIDHGGALTYSGVLATAGCAALVLGLAGATGFALVRTPRLGLVGAWFFIVLAPSSSVVPLLDTMFEHRMYLALAAPLLLIVLGVETLMGTRARPALITLILAAGLLTAARNHFYRSDVALWTDNTRHTPANARAHFQLAGVLLARGQTAEAITRYERAIALRPEYVEARHNLGGALLQSGRVMDAIIALEGALRLRPLAASYYLLAGAHAQLGRVDAALTAYDAALALQPAHVDALNNRGNLRQQKANSAGALADYETALRADPAHVDARLNAAVALLSLHRPAEAIAHCEAAVQLRPDYGAAHWKFGDTLLALNRPAAAAERYREAVRLDPSLFYAWANLGRALAATGRLPEALAAYERALKLAPDWPLIRLHYALALEASDRPHDAAVQNAHALRLQPDFPEAATQRARLQSRGFAP
ncbi:MAG: tetratricopeptide repeat protein [Opitutaceae bacterium]|nr:tetratricopeptide repeat protein [Opitutaceae bacterium]